MIRLELRSLAAIWQLVNPNRALKNPRPETDEPDGFSPAETQEPETHTGKPEGDLEAVEQLVKPAAARQTIVLPVRPPSAQEEARDRALAAIAANKDTAPWGDILHDLAVALGQRMPLGVLP